MGQCRSSNCNKYPTLVRDANGGESCRKGERVNGNSLYFVLSFAVKLQPLYKMKSINKRGKKPSFCHARILIICSKNSHLVFLFYTFTFHLSVSFCFICVSYKQHMLAFCFVSNLRSSVSKEGCWTIYIVVSADICEFLFIIWSILST